MYGEGLRGQIEVWGGGGGGGGRREGKRPRNFCLRLRGSLLLRTSSVLGVGGVGGGGTWNFVTV